MILEIKNLDVHYGRAHALQGVSLSFEKGIVAVVGRNGMGKTTLCNAVTGLVPARGSVKFNGAEILGLPAHAITERGIGYVPQGRRVWPSLSVDEHLRLAARKGPWTVERVYNTFPRLAERKRNGGAELSGGEQQMLAISRALLFNPKLLVMDEPTEGLAPIIVQQVAAMLKALAAEGEISVLLIEQNLGVAIDVADTIDVMVNGRIARSMPAAGLAADLELQQRLLGVRMAEEEVAPPTEAPAPEPIQILTVKRANDELVPPDDGERTIGGVNRWGVASSSAEPKPEARVVEFPVAQTAGRAAYIAGTFDTKGRELFYLKSCLEKLGLRTVTVDLATSGKPSSANIHPREVARHHPKGERSVFTNDRGSAVSEMAIAFEHFIVQRRDLGGLISAGGSGGTALATQAMRRLPIGIPKMMVSTVASGDVRPYVGPSDICMMYSVTDISGINRISEKVLSNAAHALAGMIAYRKDRIEETKPALGLTMFGLTTPCVQAVCKELEARYDCIVFHATGTG
ncbi:MAG TPA: Tm-1-like ATP-binding domain-containing protein, partial [Burkholderiales bacterium]